MKPTALHVPYRVSQPRLPIAINQLDDMESKGIISKVTVPTDWCSGMVQVPKEDPTQIRICADLTKLNQAVKRDTHPSSSVESTLAKISGAKFTSTLDANSGYYQIPLEHDSRLLTTFITPFGRYCYNRVSSAQGCSFILLASPYLSHLALHRIHLPGSENSKLPGGSILGGGALSWICGATAW